MSDDVGVAAFSEYGPRKLRADDADPLMKVRRTADNAEQDFGFLADGNLDTTALLAFAGAGGATISAFYDQSGNARTMLQSTVANQPLIVDNGSGITKNERPAMRFDGSASPEGCIRRPLCSRCFEHSRYLCCPGCG